MKKVATKEERQAIARQVAEREGGEALAALNDILRRERVEEERQRKTIRKRWSRPGKGIIGVLREIMGRKEGEE